MEYFGLDIGSENLRLAQLQPVGDGRYKIAALAASSLAKSIESEAEADLALIAQVIRNAVVAAKISTQNVVCALSEDKVFTEIIEMPQMSDKELDSAIEWEADQYIPIPLAETALDYQIISRPEKASKGKIKVLLVAAPKNLVNKYINVLEMANLKPVIFETEAVALARALISDHAEPSMIIDLGARATDIAVVEGGLVVLTRSIPSAGRAISRALASSLGLKPKQADSYKKAYGIDESKFEGKIKKAINPVLEAIVEETEKTLSFYESQGAKKVERILLTGGTAELPGLAHFFVEKLNIEVEIGDPFQRITNAEKVLANLEKGTASIYSLVFGLAMREI